MPALKALSPHTLAEIQQAATLIRAGGVVAYPTEAVYGLGCDPENEAAVLRLLALKNRPVHKGLILIAADIAQLTPWIAVSLQQQETMLATWPGPVTWLVPATDKVPHWVRGEHPTVAVRVCGHPIARELCAKVGKPIVSTSANTAGSPPCRVSQTVQQHFSQQLDYVVQGHCNLAAEPSTIMDLVTGEKVRG